MILSLRDRSGEREAKAWAQIDQASQEFILVGMKEEPLEDQ